MAKSTRSASPAINPSPTSPGDVELGDPKQEIVHTEIRTESLAPHHKWKISATVPPEVVTPQWLYSTVLQMFVKQLIQTRNENWLEKLIG
jgi:hypothetical protein